MEKNMLRYQLERIRKWIVIIGFSTAASMFWGAIIAAAVKYMLHIDGHDALVFIGVPIMVLLDIYFIPRAGKYFGF